MATKRTTHRSSKGKKLYAVRDKTGSFKDIQTYKKAHGSDVKRKAKAELRSVLCKACKEHHTPRDACKVGTQRTVAAFMKAPQLYDVEKVVTALSWCLRDIAKRSKRAA